MQLPSTSTTSYSMRTVVVDEPIEEIEESIDYSQYTVAELKSIADEKGIKYNSTIKKADLIALIEEEA